MNDEQLQSVLNDIRDDVKFMRVLLTGNGTPEKGLIVKVDRLEQSANLRGKWFWLIAGTLAANAIAFAKTVFG